MTSTIDGSGMTAEMWERQERMFDDPDVLTRLTGHRDGPRQRRERPSAVNRRNRNARRRQLRLVASQQLDNPATGRHPSQREIKQHMRKSPRIQ